MFKTMYSLFEKDTYARRIITMSGKTFKDIQTNEPIEAMVNTYELADGINNALFGIVGNAELIRLKISLKISKDCQIDDHVSSILRLAQKIALLTTQLSMSTKTERSRD